MTEPTIKNPFAGAFPTPRYQPTAVAEEIAAISVAFDALEPLDAEARKRALRWLRDRLT